MTSRFENPLGEKFEVPQKCRKLHVPSNKVLFKKFQCTKLRYEDVMDFRARLYRSIEKKDQQEFLVDFIKPMSTKSHRYSNLKTARLITVSYFIQNLSGEKVPVCRDQFQAVTGLTDQKTKSIYRKIYKRELLLEGDTSHRKVGVGKNPEHADKIREMLATKKEKILSLEKGTYDQFVKAISGQKAKDEENLEFESVMIESLAEEKLPRRRGRSKKKKDEEQEVQEEEIVESYDRILLDLNELETCRICLQNYEHLIHLFKKLGSAENTAAELIDYCLAIKISPNDELPQKICPTCLDKVRKACELKNNYLESLKIMEKLVKEKSSYKFPRNSTVLEDYVAQNDPMEDPEMTVEMLEEFLDDPIIEDHNQLETSQPQPSSESRPKKCYLCDCNFDTTAEDHFSTVHSLIQPMHCSKCEFETEFPWFLNLHYQVHEEFFRLCPHCGRRFEPTEVDKFAAHKMRCKNRDMPKKDYACEFCNALYRSSSHVRTHIRKVHTGEVSPRFPDPHLLY